MLTQQGLEFGYEDCWGKYHITWCTQKKIKMFIAMLCKYKYVFLILQPVTFNKNARQKCQSYARELLNT